MKKITFEITFKEEYSIASLLKDVNEISCRMIIDLENNCITVKGLENDLINNVIELINKYYKIITIVLDNTSEEETENVVETPLTEKIHEKGSAVEETAILDAIGFAFDKLDTTKTPKSQIEGFLVNIGMNAVDKNMNKILISAFNTAYNVEKINYENIILGIKNEIPSMKETEIKNALKTIFKDWLTKYPKLAERCPKISLMAILKVWQKKFA